MILVTGATGYTGRFLLRRLVQSGYSLRCLVRPTSDRTELDRCGAEVWTGDLENPGEVRGAFVDIRRVLHLAHIRFVPTIVECLDEAIEHIVLVSSLRRFSRVSSTSLDDVVRGEECALQAGIPFTILRPSMIYGPGDDRNISHLATYLQRYKWIPVFGSGRHLQQPVYVEDVVGGILTALERPQTIGKSYALAGPEALTHNQLIDLVGEVVGVRPVKMHIPVGLALAGFWCLKKVGMQVGIDADQIRRLQEDKSFSIAEAQADLDFAPVKFGEGLARIYRKGNVSFSRVDRKKGP